MMKTSTTKRIGMAIVMLFMCVFTFAEEVHFDFKKNPMKWPEGKNKMELNTDYTYQDIVFTPTKFDGRYKTYLNRGFLSINSDNQFKLKALKGKRIKKVLFQIRMNDEYSLEPADKQVQVRESPVLFYHEWTEPKEEITFDNTSRITTVEVTDMYVTLEGGETPETPEEPVPTTTVTYDFNSLNPAWGVENVDPSTYDSKAGKIEDGHPLLQEGVKLTVSNVAEKQVVRVFDHILMVPATSGLTLEAPEGKTIEKVEIVFASTRSYLKAKGTDDELEAIRKTATHKVDAQKVSYEAVGGRSQIAKINVFLKNSASTGITTVREAKQKDNRVYNLNGVVVGTLEQLSTLPKGIYIVNGTKILVN